MRSKYDPLREYLAARRERTITLTFTEIERLVGPLPASARRLREWWSNEESGSHVQARAWMSAGCKVEGVDLNQARVVFAAQRPR